MYQVLVNGIRVYKHHLYIRPQLYFLGNLTIYYVGYSKIRPKERIVIIINKWVRGMSVILYELC